MTRSLILAALGSFAFLTAFADEVKLDDVKCVVQATKNVKADKFVEYKGGKIYFCCGNCPKAFASDKEKFASRANWQLVATSQAKQKKCPLTGKDLNPETEISISGAKVQFCCNMCKGKVEKTEDDAKKIDLVFSEDAWKKGEFKVETKKATN